MNSPEEKLKFYKLSLFSTIAFLFIMTIAFSYTIYDFQVGIKRTVENDLNLLRSEVTKAIELSSPENNTGLSDFLTQQFIGAVIAFNGTRCPSGWQEYKPAYGRFIRGIDNGIKKVDPDGIRKPGSIQESATALPQKGFSGFTTTNGRHIHKNSGQTGFRTKYGNNDNRESRGPTEPAGEHNHSVTIDGGGDIETRPTNIALLYCEKL
ncbi:MAG: hypothetical protein JAY97_08840 [Candidatus Thiodiazotropha sp. 'RUGA']|nr:hypothetical protein [Candidatus Thiodiazotropha sp. 'RUGA']